MIGIRGEIPQFKRCCICLPLRHGLIVWAYIRLVIGVILLVCATISFFQTLATFKNEADDVVYLVMFGFFVILGGADIVLNVVFVYAGHKKNLKMLKAYYIYSLILWILMIIMSGTLIVYSLYVMKLYQMNFIRVCITLFEVTVYFFTPIVIQAYVLLLVRSEFIKLTTNCEFRFLNNADESPCKMKCEDNNILVANGDNIANTHIIAHENMIAKEAVLANKDTVANTHAIADGYITANRIIIGSGDKKGVYTNGTTKSDTITY